MPDRNSEAKPLLRCLGKTVAALRSEAKLTQEEVADAAGLMSRFLQMLERGTANPSYLKLVSLAAALRVDLRVLVARAEASRE